MQNAMARQVTAATARFDLSTTYMKINEMVRGNMITARVEITKWFCRLTHTGPSTLQKVKCPTFTAL
jgi:hypothetical protein